MLQNVTLVLRGVSQMKVQGSLGGTYVAGVDLLYELIYAFIPFDGNSSLTFYARQNLRAYFLVVNTFSHED